MDESLILPLPDPAATARLGTALARTLPPPPGPALTVYLAGELGAGKTALVRALLSALGHAGRVPSPTYTLVEPYRCAGRPVHHVDLYRLADPGEAADLGLEELPEAGGLLLVEWASRGGDLVPPADLVVELAVAERGRGARLQAASGAGRQWLAALRRALL